MASTKRSILDIFEEKGRGDLLMHLPQPLKEAVAGEHQTDHNIAKATSLPSANKFKIVGIKALVSW